jgi:phage shock protein C
MQKQLKRSATNKRLFGVCGGIAEYFDIDATIIRLAFALTAVFGGAGLIAYIVAAIVMPSSSITN